MKNILLLGRLASKVNELAADVNDSQISLHPATNAEEASRQLDEQQIDLVVMGGGLDDEIRAQLCRLIWAKRDDLSIHIKDRASGPAAMAEFIKRIIKGLD
jgi:DNA-binding response OmpR family regulator